MSLLPARLLDTPLPGLGRAFQADEAEKVSKYLELLAKWQRVHRLVGSTRADWLVEHVILDSLAFLAVLPRDVASLADVGSGAGIPGVPIAIVRRDLDMVLVEARQRRVSFLTTVVRELGLGHVSVAGQRVEELGAHYAARFDAVVMRCAGPARDVLRRVLPIVRSGGVVVASAASASQPMPGGEREAVTSISGESRWFHRYVKP